MKSKNIVNILLTILAVFLSSIYLVHIDTIYDGAVDVNLVAFVFILPLIAGGQLWRIFRKNQEVVDQKAWQKIVFRCLMAGFLILALYLLISSRFYSLPAIILIVIILLGAVAIFVLNNKKTKEKSMQKPVFAWAITTISLYALICGTIFAYLQIVKPVTVEQAYVLLQEKYGENSYEFIGRLTGEREKTPLGVYWFVSKNQLLTKTVAVSVITGDIIEHE